MPITTSAKKALRQSLTRRKRNTQSRETYKKLIKEYRKLIAAKSIDQAKEKLPKVFKAIDKSAKKGVIKKNTASRLKSRLAKKIK